jgi:hypothetical protein
MMIHLQFVVGLCRDISSATKSDSRWSLLAPTAAAWGARDGRRLGLDNLASAILVLGFHFCLSRDCLKHEQHLLCQNGDLPETASIRSFRVVLEKRWTRRIVKLRLFASL